MAYYSGTATSFTDLKTTLETLLIAEGWTLTSDVLSKGVLFFKLTSNANFLRLDGGTGQSGSALTGGASYGVQLLSPSALAMVFPINYELHVNANPDEVYLVVNYNSDYYQQISFGKSNVQGIGGTGAWFTGSYNAGGSYSNANAAKCYMQVGASLVGVYSFYNYTFNVGLFTSYFYNSSQIGSSSFVNCGLDSVSSWRTQDSLTVGVGLKGGLETLSGLITSLPNLLNNSTVLLPIKPCAVRSSNGISTVLNLANARFCRIDNLVPGELVTYGSDQWKIYPFYRKDVTSRNAGDTSAGATHSGTFGFAIRYTGV